MPAVRGSAVLKDVTFGPGGILYAVGWRVLRGGATEPLILRGVGGTWIIDDVPARGLLSGIAIQPNGRPIAVGWVPTASGDRMIAIEARPSWRRVPATGGEPGRLTAVTSGEATVAVGARLADGVPVPIVMRLSDGWIPVDVAGDAAPETGGDQLLGITGELGSYLAVGIRDATEAFASLAVTGDCVG
jgi:hypothetical protein